MFSRKLLPLSAPAGDRVIARAHNGLNAYLLSCNIVKYLCPLANGGKGLLADTTAYLGDYQWGVPTASMPLKKHHNKMVCMYICNAMYVNSD